MKDHHRMRAWDGERYWYKDDPRFSVWRSPGLEARANIGDAEVELCTGLRDKNGVLIYEGDIVKAGFPLMFNFIVTMDQDEARKSKLNYSEPKKIIPKKYGNYSDGMVQTKEELIAYEIIGNIHQK